ncbi:PepSY-associated TM helix domain-containing protein [Mucilaginibacter sp.]|uniref:PepSY-associated TM helix domain-containing protein n=1 Tax=Mucilaginibacter sp. TaxID=1882438 RepID=UPI003D0961F9
MNFKKVILFIHRWLGLISGLVVLIVSITGCIYCFQDEIQDVLHSYRKVEIQNKPYIGPSVIRHIALDRYPGANATYMYYFGKDRPVGVLVNVAKQGLTYVYINPYNGKVLHTEILTENFFTVVEYIHLYLLLPPKIGQLVVGISVIIFVVLMITGIVLWWPKRKTDRKRSFTIKWGARWKRINYDLHNVLGFYATFIALIIAISGLAIAFEWVSDGIYSTANLGKSYPDEKVFPKSDSLYKPSSLQPVVDHAFEVVQQQSKKAQMFLIADNTGKGETVNITAYANSMRFGNSDMFFFDRYSGKLLRYLPNIKKSIGMKLNNLNYDIHVGQVLGLTGKIIAFLASLICATLPVTGFIIWLGKKKKAKKSPKEKLPLSPEPDKRRPYRAVRHRQSL